MSKLALSLQVTWIAAPLEQAVGEARNATHSLFDFALIPQDIEVLVNLISYKVAKLVDVQEWSCRRWTWSGRNLGGSTGP